MGRPARGPPPFPTRGGDAAHSRALTLLLAAVLAAGACAPAEDDPEELIPAGCGLPTPRPGADPELLPEEFLVERSQLVRVQKRRGGIVAAINIPYSVSEGFALYQEAAKTAGFRLAGTDNEGFEAEIYLRSKDELASVQVRRSVCEEASIVFVNIVDRDAFGG